MTLFERSQVDIIGVAASPYYFVGCQHGAETAIKHALCQPRGPFRLAFSRPGFVTLKSELSVPPWSSVLPENPFVRARGQAFERIEGESGEKLVADVLDRYGDLGWSDLHVWQRDIAIPGWHGFEPGRSALATWVGEAFEKSLIARQDPRSQRINRIADWQARILDLVIIDPHRWWIGAHVAETIADRWPGGVFPVTEPRDMISRAYLKIAEAVQWSRFPIQAGDHIVEIGSSPGGACQYLLDLGLHVVGIDPAEMDPRVAHHPRFQHVRSRSRQVKRKFFAPFRWLVCDANVAPSYTLDTVEAIVTYPTSSIEGLILTIKLSEWERAVEAEAHADRVRSWGYADVRLRQLAYNRREYCLVAGR